MKRNQSRTTCAAIALATVVTVAGTSGCGEGLSESTPRPIDTIPTTRSPATFVRAEAHDDDPPVMVLLPPDDNPTADPTDPVQVAGALVTVLTNRRPDLSDDEWRDRWRRWVTPDLEIVLAASRPNGGVYDEQVRARRGETIGIVVGSAKGQCSPERCGVLLVVDQKLLIDGRPVDARNFVSWQVDLEAADDSSWRVSDVTLGSTP